jgi:hypothetical protein
MIGNKRFSREMMKPARPLVETLESRQMLSATLTDPATLLASAQTGAVTISTPAPAQAHPKKPKPVLTTTPSLVHNYEGTLRTNGIIFGIGSRKVHIELLITAQTLTTLTGHFSVDGHDGDGTLTGFEKTNGNFSYSIKSDGFTFKVAGRVTNGGLRLGGNASVKLSSVSIFKTSGGFVATASS